MEGYRGGALGFKAGSFHAIGANLFQRKRRYLPVFVFFDDIAQNDRAFGNTHRSTRTRVAHVAPNDAIRDPWLGETDSAYA